MALKTLIGLPIRGVNYGLRLDGASDCAVTSRRVIRQHDTAWSYIYTARWCLFGKGKGTQASIQVTLVHVTVFLRVCEHIARCLWHQVRR